MHTIQLLRSFALLTLTAGLQFAASPLTTLAETCRQLTTLSNLQTDITVAESDETGVFTPPKGKPLSDLPAFCRVAAVLHPSNDSAIRVELWLPETNWNGRLEGTGNGGFAGNLAYGSLASAVKRGYAVANTDMGMATPPGEDAAIFAARPERWKDWGYRSTHEMTVFAKRVVAVYYKRPAAHNYFVGCSTGGEQAWMEAQRFPADYDGIVGGAPANNRTGVHESILWNFAVTERTPEDRIPPAKLPFLANAVMQACDALDGLKDGLISDPRQCSFDPAALQCIASDNDKCLTAWQVATVRNLYAGPVNPSTGRQIYPGLPKGSELWWSHLDEGANGQPPYAPIFIWVFGRDWNWRSFDFNRSLTPVDRQLSASVNATSTDLDAFRKLGHKLLIYHGWSDWLVVPGESISFHDALASRYSAGHLAGFYRLFMVPGMTHCSGGVGPDKFDALSTMVDWVEKEKAPDKLIASQGPRTRPLCPYPQIARYSGHGSVDDQTNFFCVVPERQ